MSSPPLITAADARTLLLQAQGLLDDPLRPATPAELSRLIRRLGYVQVDSINVIDRAHHLIIASRLTGYREAHLTHLLERRRSLFEHWTHDASVIPTRFFRHWKIRFRRFENSPRLHRWLENRLGDDPRAVIRQVKSRLRREGPLMSKDFEPPEGHKRESWWGWTPHKTALEYLWQTGRVTIRARRNFHKVYDLTERVHPDLVRQRMPGRREHLEWACSSALDRMVLATSGELSQFWQAVPPADAAAWCARAERDGRIVAVEVADEEDGRRRRAFALADWERKLSRASAAPEGIRLLCPFDPVVRDRRRLLRRFGFDYRFEAFVPAPKRRWGYYVLALLEGDRMIGRIDPKLHRDAAELEIRRVFWEDGITVSPERKFKLEQAVAALATRIGAKDIRWPTKGRNP